MTIFDKLSIHKDQNLPFVAYKKINQNELCAFFQKNDEVYLTSTFVENGFVFSSFDSFQNIVFTTENSLFLSEIYKSDADKFSKKPNQYANNSDKEKHLQLVKKAVATIKNTVCTKIVVSRKESIDVEINPIEFFKKLLHFNPTSFTYIWFHPKVGLWMGAFGEQLLKIENNFLSTMSIAGTQKVVDNQPIQWQFKEIQEQQIVTDFIDTSLKRYISSIKISTAKTIYSGNVAHLKTDISGFLKPNVKLSSIINTLHPTPAVCGFPKEESKKFIIENENYQREFYAGFLGELNWGKNYSDTNLFVNLRCLKASAMTIDIFVGGGITVDSIAENEWEETVNKAQAIKSLL